MIENESRVFVPDTNVVQLKRKNFERDPTHDNTDRPLMTMEEYEARASYDLGRAREGIPGPYAVDPEANETFYFLVESFYSKNPHLRNNLFIRVFPLSYWVDGERDDYVPLPEKGERSVWIPAAALWGRCNYDRIPEEHRGYLDDWIPLLVDGAKRYDEYEERRIDESVQGCLRELLKQVGRQCRR